MNEVKLRFIRYRGFIRFVTVNKELMTIVGKQREVMQMAFETLGGSEKLIEWANESSDNYKEFIKLYVKLVPPIKPDKQARGETQESFIMGLIKAENILQLKEGQPQQIIDVDSSS